MTASALAASQPAADLPANGDTLIAGIEEPRFVVSDQAHCDDDQPGYICPMRL